MAVVNVAGAVVIIAALLILMLGLYAFLLYGPPDRSRGVPPVPRRNLDDLPPHWPEDGAPRNGGPS